MNQEIHRQHAETSMDELVGLTCDQFIGVYSPELARHLWFYLTASGISHRFYQDAGCLFWRSDETLDPEDDLCYGESYEDLGELLNTNGARISEISFKDFVLVMKFQNGARISFTAGIEDVGSECVERQRGSA